MKKAMGFILAVVFCSSVVAQSKQDYQWLMGTDGSVEPGIQINRLDFNQQEINKSQETFPFRMFGNITSICDRDGALLFYTNGTAIGNAALTKMVNGDSINAGPFLFDFWGYEDGLWGYPGPQNILALTDPCDELGYYLLHKLQSFYPDSIDAFFLEEIRFSYIDMRLDGGRGAVTEKIKTFYLGDKILSSYFTAIYHDNGHDWWVIQPKEDSNQYLTFLIDSMGIHRYPDQSIDHTFHWRASASGSARFSPDGEKYAFYNVDDQLLLFEFDRSTGLLSEMQKFHVHDTISDALAFSSVEWSPNSRFIYVSVMTKLYQIDTWESNLEDGLELIDIYNGSVDPFANNLYFMVLGPDCKIYMCSTNGNRSYHVINKPNEKGQLCDFVQGAFRLPSSGVGYMPNFPRWRVDEEEKCDPGITSMFGELVFYNRELKVYPNPASHRITIELPTGHEQGFLRMIDLNGRIVIEQKVMNELTEIQLNVSHLTSGYYEVEFLPKKNPQKYIFTSPVVVVN